MNKKRRTTIAALFLALATATLAGAHGLRAQSEEEPNTELCGLYSGRYCGSTMSCASSNGVIMCWRNYYYYPPS